MFSNCCLAAEKMRENFNESTSVVENWVFRYPSAWTKWCKVPIFFFLNQMLCLAEESESKTKKKKNQSFKWNFSQWNSSNSMSL